MEAPNPAARRCTNAFTKGHRSNSVKQARSEAGIGQDAEDVVNHCYQIPVCRTGPIPDEVLDSLLHHLERLLDTAPFGLFMANPFTAAFRCSPASKRRCIGNFYVADDLFVDVADCIAYARHQLANHRSRLPALPRAILSYGHIIVVDEEYRGINDRFWVVPLDNGMNPDGGQGPEAGDLTWHGDEMRFLTATEAVPGPGDPLPEPAPGSEPVTVTVPLADVVPMLVPALGIEPVQIPGGRPNWVARFEGVDYEAEDGEEVKLRDQQRLEEL